MIKIIGNQNRKSKFDPNLAQKVNKEAEEQERKEKLEAKLKPKQEEKKERQEQEKQIINHDADSLDNFIYVPSIGLYIAKEKTLHDLTWYETWKKLEKQGLKMPTIYEFKEFLKYLHENKKGTKDASKQEIETILDEILTVRSPWRAEWLDAYFEKRKDGMYILTENKTKSEKLDDYLEEDRTPGIDLNDWLNNSNARGLPKEKAKKGKLYYWSPESGGVAGFYADSDWAGLGCYRDPEYSSSALGVRFVREVSQKFWELRKNDK